MLFPNEVKTVKAFLPQRLHKLNNRSIDVVAQHLQSYVGICAMLRHASYRGHIRIERKQNTRCDGCVYLDGKVLRCDEVPELPTSDCSSNYGCQIWLRPVDKAAAEPNSVENDFIPDSLNQYKHMDRVAYQKLIFFLRNDIEYTKNPHILKWWNNSFDDLLRDRISVLGWRWHIKLGKNFLEKIPTHLVENWRTEDPLCAIYLLEGLIEHFAAKRALELNLKVSELPRRTLCQSCNSRIYEEKYDDRFLKHLGWDNVSYCEGCINTALYEQSDDLAPEKVIIHLRELTDAIGKIPISSDFRSSRADLLKIEPEKVNKVIRVLLKSHPSLVCVKELFDSWLNALIKSDLLADGARRTYFGTQCIANDGHLCLSMAEKIIDDWLFANKIAHEKEPLYPNSRMRADFKIEDTFIEYFGLTGKEFYDEKKVKKIAICRELGIPLVAIEPDDILELSGLESKLAFLRSSQQL